MTIVIYHRYNFLLLALVVALMPGSHIRAAIPPEIQEPIAQLKHGVESDDPKAIVDSFSADDDLRPVLTALADRMVAEHKLRQLAALKFGDAGKDLANYMAATDEALGLLLQHALDCDTQINADTAIVSTIRPIKGLRGGSFFILKRVNGVWKIDAPSKLHIGATESYKKRIAFYQSETELADKAAKLVEDKSIVDAKSLKEYLAHEHEALEEQPFILLLKAATAPATQPETETDADSPSSQPAQ